jgi:hypothetical protein
MFRKPEAIRGHVIRKPRLTLVGYMYLLRYLGLPFLGALVALDAVLYLIFRFGFDVCYGLFCYL